MPLGRTQIWRLHTTLLWEITDYARAAFGLQYKMDYTKIKETNFAVFQSEIKLVTHCYMRRLF